MQKMVSPVSLLFDTLLQLCRFSPELFFDFFIDLRMEQPLEDNLFFFAV
ncbi:Uncharacterised protein [Mycobacteroides abscessus subsp. abscessus]|nr:Uncharacterised protein [Mycobacteroides abscessus subsp. abscessus]